MAVEKPKHFIVIVPGYMGSLLRDKKKGDIVWLDVAGLLKNPSTPATRSAICWSAWLIQMTTWNRPG